MSTTPSKFSDTFLRTIPKLQADGRNWITYRDRLTLCITAQGLLGYLDGTVTEPADPATRDESASHTPDEVSENEEHAKLDADWKQKQAIVLQYIASTIPDSLYLKIKGKQTAKEAWDTLKAEFESRTRMFIIDLRRRLQDEKCDENGNLRTHFDTMRTMREELAALGHTISNTDFTAILLGSLPKSYDSYLSAVTATVSFLDKELESDALMHSVIDEYDRRAVKKGPRKDKTNDAAFYAGGGSKGSRDGNRSKRDVECFNCHKKGHKKADCWAKGGGKEGQGPKSKKGKDGKESGDSASAAAEVEEGVWMAALDDSDESDDFDWELNEEDQWMLGDDEYVPPIIRGTEPLSTSSDDDDSSDAYEDLPDLMSCSDSSDDEDDCAPGTAALHVNDESDDDVDIDPYWAAIRIDELRGLGKPKEVVDESLSDSSMPDLEAISTIATSDSITLYDSDEESDEYELKGHWLDGLEKDEGEEAFTHTFDCAMLVNVQGSLKGAVTELYDSGASRHMSPYRHLFENYVTIQPKSITAADKRYFQATGKGDLRIQLPNGNSTTSILLKDVLHCPDMGLTLVAISKITAAGYPVIFRGSTCKIFDQRKKAIGEIKQRNGLYRVDHDDQGQEMAGTTQELLNIEQLHRYMGHISPDSAKRMVKDGSVSGIELDESTTLTSCDSCEYAKAIRKPIKRAHVEPRASAFGDEIHSDLWGKSPVQTPGKKEYYVSFTDDHTRWTHLALLHSKDETFEAYKDFESWAKTQHKIPAIKCLRSDRGGEYLDGEFGKHLKAEGTIRKLTTHDTPEYNGVAERLNRTLLEHTRAMLHASKLPRNLWGEAVTHAVWLKNRTPTKALPDGKTPYEALYGRKPDLSQLKEWGSRVWVHDSSGSKLDGRSNVGHWVGFDAETPGAHRIYWGHGRVSVERNVKFDEDTIVLPNAVPLKGENGISDQQRVPDASVPDDSPNPEVTNYDEIPEHPTQTPSTDDWLGTTFNRITDELAVGRSRRVRQKSDYIKRIESGEGTADNRPSKADLPKGIQIESEIQEIEGEPEERGSVEYAMAAAIAEAEAMDPKTINEARRRPDWPKWNKAIQAEMDALTKAETWIKVERPKDRNVVQSKWVFKIKKDAEGMIERYKARLVAKGFTQVENIDYYETWAPVAKLASIRTILAIAARNSWAIDMFDFHSAFLNGELDDDEEVYMEYPPGLDEIDTRQFCLRLKKLIYGLKQAGRKWYDVVCRTFASLGFKKSEADPAVFYLHFDGNILIMAIHVDDCTITGNNNDLIQQYKKKIQSKYSLTDLGPINWLLGIKVTRDREAKTISLSQSSYIDSILTRFNFADCKPVATPMDPSMRFSKDQCPQTTEEIAEMRKVPYLEAVGSLNYLAVATRPDISFSVSLLAQFMGNPGRVHWEAVKRVFRYLKGTRDWKLVYGTEQDGLKGYTDADGASQEHRHAISGYAFLIDRGAVSWSSKKQELVTLSTAEAEYVAATYAAKEAIWLRRLLGEVFQPLANPVTLYSDSQSAIALTRDGSYHARTKHIDIRYHFIRFVVQNGTINLIYCPTDDMTADTLTKALPSIKAKHFATALGLRSA